MQPFPDRGVAEEARLGRRQAVPTLPEELVVGDGSQSDPARLRPQAAEVGDEDHRQRPEDPEPDDASHLEASSSQDHRLAPLAESVRPAPAGPRGQPAEADQSEGQGDDPEEPDQDAQRPGGLVSSPTPDHARSQQEGRGRRQSADADQDWSAPPVGTLPADRRRRGAPVVPPGCDQQPSQDATHHRRGDQEVHHGSAPSLEDGTRRTVSVPDHSLRECSLARHPWPYRYGIRYERNYWAISVPERYEILLTATFRCKRPGTAPTIRP